MTGEVVSYLLTAEDPKMKLKFRLIWQCGPLLKGIKCASMLKIDLAMAGWLSQLLVDTGITCRILGVKEDWCLVLLFRRRQMESLLQNQENRRVLMASGYADPDPERLLLHLSCRVQAYLSGDGAFPHEAGIFLDYPVEDVKGYMAGKGQGCLLSGYWKVYHNPEKAQMAFLGYDKARTSAVNEFLSGKGLGEIAALWEG